MASEPRVVGTKIAVPLVTSISLHILNHTRSFISDACFDLPAFTNLNCKISDRKCLVDAILDHPILKRLHHMKNWYHEHVEGSLGKYMKQWPMLRMKIKGCIMAQFFVVHNQFLSAMPTDVANWACVVSNVGFIQIYAPCITKESTLWCTLLSSQFLLMAIFNMWEIVSASYRWLWRYDNTWPISF